MKRLKRHISIILSALMLATFPCLSYGAAVEAPGEEATNPSDKVSGTGGTFSVPVDLSNMTKETAVMDELLVLVEPETEKKDIVAFAEEAGANLDNMKVMDDGSKLVKVSIEDPENAGTVANELNSDNQVILVQPNYVYRLDEESSSTQEESQIEQEYQAAADASEDADSEEATSAQGDGIGSDVSEESQIKLEGEIGSDVSEEVVDGKMITQWYMGSEYSGSTRSFEAWENLSQEGDEVIVAVIDTGVKLDHPDLEGRLIEDRCVTFNNGKELSFTAIDGADDDNGHGTHVSGIIAAEAHDDFGIAGVSNNRARLIVIDAALKKTKEFTTQDVVLAIDYAIKNGASIINMSIGGLCRDYLLENTVNNAYDKGVLCVCAAGNESSQLTVSPGDSPGAISVRAHDQYGSEASFTNYGFDKDVSAPGVRIVSTYISSGSNDGARYVQLNGTSMASPVVAGLAALLKSEDASLTPRQLKNLIYTSTNAGGFNARSFGFGKINAVNAVNNLEGGSTPEKILLNRNSVAMYPDEEIDLEYAVYPGKASAYADAVSFVSSNTKVAKVDAGGRITAVAKGTATITAECSGKKASCEVTVRDIPYEKVEVLPFSKTGHFSPSDPRVRVTDGKKEWEAMTDGYEIPNVAGGKDVNVTVTCAEAIPYIRAFDPSGNEIPVEKSESMKNNNSIYVLTASFATATSGSYRLQVMGETDGGTTVDKSYDININIPGMTTNDTDDSEKDPSANTDPTNTNPTNRVVVKNIRNASVSRISSKTYNGRSQRQNLTVRYGSTKLRYGQDYTVQYRNNRNVGMATVVISGKGNYTGYITARFRIIPRGTAVTKLSNAKKAVKVRWARQSTKMSKSWINGYQVQISTDRRFKKGVKTISVKGYNKTSLKVGKLKAKTRYFVRVRTYKKVSNRTYWSVWSRTGSTKTR